MYRLHTSFLLCPLRLSLKIGIGNGNSEENEIRDLHEQSNPPPLGGGLVQNLRLTLCPMSPSQVAVHGENTVHSVHSPSENIPLQIVFVIFYCSL